MRRAPSEKMLMERLYNVDRDKAQRIRGLIKGTIEPDTYASVKQWVNSCYNRPADVELIMSAINEELECYGVEGVSIEGVYINRYWSDTLALYCNGGDTYHVTILYDTDKDRFIIASWGDFYERASNEHKVCQHCGVAGCKDHKEEY